MNDDFTLVSPDQLSLLTWLNKQPNPVSLKDMRNSNAPGYDDRRIQNMIEAGFLDYGRDFSGGGWGVIVYWISDKGKAVLLAAQQAEEDRAQRERAQARQEELTEIQNQLAETQNRLTEAQNELMRTQNSRLRGQIIVAIVTFLLTMLIEHFGGLASVILKLFG